MSVPVESMLSTMKNLRLRVHFCESVPKTHTSIQYLVAIHKLYKKKFSRSYFKIWSLCCIHLDKNNAGTCFKLSKYSKHFVSNGNSYKKPTILQLSFMQFCLLFVLKGLNSLPVHYFHTFHVSWKGRALCFSFKKIYKLPTRLNF